MLPCDLICELNGTALLETWLVHQAALGGSLNDTSEFDTAQPALGGELAGRRGGLGLWYPAKGEEAVKNEETDFILTTDTRASTVVSGGFGMGMKLERLVYTTPMDSLKDSLELHKAFRLRNSLLRKFNKINLHTAYRDSHIYFLPYWVLEFMSENDRFDSIAEDVLGWWSKATWQEALRYKLSLQDILLGNQTRAEDGLSSSVTRQATQRTASQVDLRTLMSTTESHNSIRSEFDLPNQGITHNEQAQIPPVPPLLACLVPSQPQAPLIRRVDTPQLLLSVSLRLAKLLAVEDVGRASASPLAHIAKIAHPETIPKRCTVHASDSLLGNNVTVKEKVNIKESVIGAKCEIGEGVKLLRCVLMEEVQIGDYCHLTDCILGKRSKIEGGSARDEEKTVLKECEVQEGYLITWGSKWTFLSPTELLIADYCR